MLPPRCIHEPCKNMLVMSVCISIPDMISAGTVPYVVIKLANAPDVIPDCMTYTITHIAINNREKIGLYPLCTWSSHIGSGSMGI